MSLEITFRCPPEWEGLLPKPVPGRQSLPDWLKSMPADAHSALLGQDVRTVKHCPPFLDAMGGGWLMPLLCDVEVTPEKEFTWGWDLPVSTLDRLTRSPLSLHVAAQLQDVPFVETGMAAIKFNSAWTVQVPEGWSVLFTHPVNRFDLPFRTLSGIVDCDAFSHGFVHFPALWTDQAWHGTLQRGTPVAQLWPIPQDVTGVFGTLDNSDAGKVEETLDLISAARGGYRKNFRKQ